MSYYIENSDTLVVKNFDSALTYQNTQSFRDQIKTIILQEGISQIPSHSFAYFQSLQRIEWPTTMHTIGQHSFAGCTSLTELVLPEGLMKVSESAFQEATSVSILSLPSTLTAIGNLAFFFGPDNTLKKINVAPSNPCFASVDGVLFSKDQTVLHQYPRQRAGKAYAIPDTVREIADSAFAYSELSEITMPPQLEKLGSGAFSFCPNIEFARVPQGVTQIPSYAFFCCEKMEQIDLPATLQGVGNEAFANCSALKSIKFPDGMTQMEYAVVAGCNAIEVLEIPASVTDIDAYAAYDCEHLHTVVMHEGVKNIWEKAFGNCPNLTNIRLPKSIEHISDDVFVGCPAMQK